MNTSIEQQLSLKFPVFWGKWPIEEEFARYLINLVVANRPQRIIELGSGLSTLFFLKTWQKLGIKGRMISVDSDAQFLENTINVLRAEEVYDESVASLIYAPLKTVLCNGETYTWYDSSGQKMPFAKIDLLFVDGPVGALCKNARYPAVPMLRKYLGKGSKVVLHDAKRPDETEIVERWKRENPDIVSIQEIDTERGGVAMRF